MMLEALRAFILGTVQGLTEFFPVSSSGHLILVPHLFGWSDQGILFDVILHVGTLAALVWVFRTDLSNICIGALKKRDPVSRRLLGMLFVAATPGLLFGGLFQDWIEANLRSVYVVIFGLVFWGIVLWITDVVASKRKQPVQSIDRITWMQAILIGCVQAISLFPGTSRSGITITGGLATGLDRSTAVRFSFLVSIPTIAAAGAYGVYQLFNQGMSGVTWVGLVIGLLSSTIAGIWAIQFLRSYVEKYTFLPFILYRFALAFVVFWVVA